MGSVQTPTIVMGDKLINETSSCSKKLTDQSICIIIDVPRSISGYIDTANRQH